ncbi:MAG TPA: AbrB/MazE/SpoVT family DNA-binding domain-containing protein [Thermoanaerobaculia bacterium]
MKKRLSLSGDSVAIVLDKPLLDAVGVDAGSEVDVSTNGDVIVITPVRDSGRRRELEKILDDLDDEYAGVFRRLAE